MQNWEFLLMQVVRLGQTDDVLSLQVTCCERDCRMRLSQQLAHPCVVM